MVKVAVIGTGAKVESRLEKWDLVEHANVVGVVGGDTHRLKETSVGSEVPVFTGLRDLLAQTDVEVIDFVGPGFLNRESIRQVAEAGKTVLAGQGALGASVTESDELIALCEQHDVSLYIGHRLRFAPVYVDARKHVQNGAIGRPGVVRLSRVIPKLREHDSSGGDENQDQLLTSGVDEWDWLRWTFGEVTRVMVRRVKSSGVECILTTLRLEDGTVAHVALSQSHVASEETTFELAGDQGMISYDSRESFPLRLQTSPASRVELFPTEDLLVQSPGQRWLEHVVRCLAGQAEPISSTQDARKAVEIAAAVIQSAKNGKPVSIDGRGDAK